MKVSIDMAKEAIQGNDYSTLITTIPDVLKTIPDDEVNLFQSDFKKWMKTKKDLFTIDHLGPAITRNEARCNIDDMTSHLKNYVNVLFAEIAERMNYCDSDGTTCWSEAPAESIFSVFKMVIHGRESLTLKHTVALCRVITNGPAPATIEADTLNNNTDGLHGMAWNSLPRISR